MTAPKITGGTITGSTINNSAIGGTTTAAGAFTTLSATGVTTVQAGTVSLPAITTSGDTNTGIFFPAADTIAFTEGGVESMRIDSAGRILLGNTTSNNTVYLSTAFAPGLQVYSVSGTGGFYRYTANSDPCVLTFAKSRNATIGSQTVVSSGDNLGYIGFAGSDGTNFITAASIIGIVDGTPGTNDMPGRLVFFTTADGANSPTERMRIDSSGNLLVGTTSATYSSATRGLIELNGSSTSLFAFKKGGTASAYLQSATNFEIQNINNSAMTFATNDTERMRILSTGTLLFSGASGETTAEATGTITTYANASAPYVVHNVDAQGSGFTFNIFKRVGTTVGNIAYNGTGVTFTTTSDYRLKENIRPAINALDMVAKLKPRLFNWKETGEEELGFIAHEFQEEFPNAVAGEKDAVETYLDDEGNEQTRIKPQGIDTSFLVATLTAAIQELNAKVEAQALEIATLKAK
jgi:hypothetical protein